MHKMFSYLKNKIINFLINKNTSYVFRLNLAGNPNTPPETLTLLASSSDYGVRINVAGNPNTPPETLTLLANDEYWIRYNVARNPNTPQYVKDYLTARSFMEDYTF